MRLARFCSRSVAESLLSLACELEVGWWGSPHRGHLRTRSLGWRVWGHRSLRATPGGVALAIGPGHVSTLHNAGFVLVSGSALPRHASCIKQTVLGSGGGFPHSIRCVCQGACLACYLCQFLGTCDGNGGVGCPLRHIWSCWLRHVKELVDSVGGFAACQKHAPRQ